MMGGFWTRTELQDLNDFQDELTAVELMVVIRRRSINSIRDKLLKLGLVPESRTCRYCFKSFKPNRRDQTYCCTNCCQLKARWRYALAREEQ
jgi:hypothetical protein